MRVSQAKFKQMVRNGASVQPKPANDQLQYDMALPATPEKEAIKAAVVEVLAQMIEAQQRLPSVKPEPVEDVAQPELFEPQIIEKEVIKEVVVEKPVVVEKTIEVEKPANLEPITEQVAWLNESLHVVAEKKQITYEFDIMRDVNGRIAQVRAIPAKVGDKKLPPRPAVKDVDGSVSAVMPSVDGLAATVNAINETPPSEYVFNVERDLNNAVARVRMTKTK